MPKTIQKRTRRSQADGKTTPRGRRTPAGGRKSAPSSSARGKNLVIVESPTKARALRGFLGRGYRVLASMGRRDHALNRLRKALAIAERRGDATLAGTLRTRIEAIERTR